jgi:hypothetical protein
VPGPCGWHGLRVGGECEGVAFDLDAVGDAAFVECGPELVVVAVTCVGGHQLPHMRCRGYGCAPGLGSGCEVLSDVARFSERERQSRPACTPTELIEPGLTFVAKNYPLPSNVGVLASSILSRQAHSVAACDYAEIL